MKTYTLSQSNGIKKLYGIAIFIAIVFVSVFIGIGVDLLLPREYQAKAVIVSADSSRITGMNKASYLLKLEAKDTNQGLYHLSEQLEITKERAFSEFISAYISADTRRKVFIDRGLYRLEGYENQEDSLEFQRLVSKFSDRFSYKIVKQGDDQLAYLYFTFHNAEGSAELLNFFIDHAAGVAATSLHVQYINKISQVNELLARVVKDYQSIYSNLKASSNILEPKTTQDNSNFMLGLKHKELQARALASSLKSIENTTDLFKPVRIVSLAYPANSVALLSSKVIIGASFILGLIIAVLILFSLNRKRRIKIISD